MTEMEFEDKNKKAYDDLLFDVKYDKEQLKDPVAIGLAIYRLAEERKKTNHLFQQILERLAALEAALGNAPSVNIPQSTVNSPGLETGESNLLSELDNSLLDYIKNSGKVDAEGVRERFDYRGKNAASARLNSLYTRGLLSKGRAGKKVMYWVRE